MQVRHLAILAAVIFVASPAIAGAQSAATQSVDEQAVLDVVHRLFDGMRASDSAMIRSTFATGVRFARLNTRATPSVIAFDTVDGWLGAVAASGGRWDEQIFDVQVQTDGELAQVWAQYTFYLDKKVLHCGVDALQLLRDAGGWKVTQLADTHRRENCRDVLAAK